MKRLIPLLIPFLILPVAACGGDGADTDFGGGDLGEDRFAVQSENGGVRMALTDRFVYFALSDSVRAVAEAELQQDTASEGIAGAIGGLVRSGVSRALGFRTGYPIEEIRDIRWEDGRMVFDFVDPDRSLSRSFKVDDRPVEEAFARSDVEAFAARFRRVKASRSATSP